MAPGVQPWVGMKDGLRPLSPVERILYLKSLPLFADAQSAPVTTVASQVTVHVFPAGSLLFRAGEISTQVHFVVDGRVRVERQHAVERRGPGDMVGLRAALRRDPATASCVAETPARTLALGADELFAVLSEHFEVARALLRALARRVEHRDRLPAARWRKCGAAAPLTLLDKIMLLKHLPLLAGAPVTALARLAADAAEHSWDAGQPLYRAGEPAEAFYLCRRSRLALGALDVLAQGGYARTLAGNGPARLLRVPGDALFDLLEDHADITRTVASVLARPDE